MGLSRWNLKILFYMVNFSFLALRSREITHSPPIDYGGTVCYFFGARLSFSRS